MKSTTGLKVLVAIFIAFSSNSILSLAANRHSNNVGSEVNEMLLSATTCPNTHKDKDGNSCPP